MKRITLIILVLLSSIAVKAQCDLPYKSLSDFNHDIEQFKDYNFIVRANCYKDKTVENILNDINAPITYVISEMNRNDTKKEGIYLYWGEKNVVLILFNEIENPDFSLDGKWSETASKYYKNRIIKAVYVPIGKDDLPYNTKKSKSNKPKPKFRLVRGPLPPGNLEDLK
ncbi:hypothetical protein [Dysgonomonas sp. 25]|uniref:hypothetical protein n=1 Tax=Dysgonomonas sp. 25 TaxID=2302933 RepID=UPI0013D27B22|nr:hypothetical protein [Dysgonomonas sp. 25]NDV69770.1 hypothetical protein [Dysgonomonas sp. 25]